jgi:branched-chain amino acid transport system substrate-binding protein
MNISQRGLGRPPSRRRAGRLAAVTIAAASSVALAACSSSGGASGDSTGGGGENPSEILIGIAGTLTGGGAAYGTPQSNAASMVADAINADGGIKELGGAKLKVVLKDTQSNAATAGQVIRQLAQQKVSALIGPMISTDIVANKPLVQNLKIPNFTGVGTSVVTEDNVNGYFFRTSSTTTITAQATADYVKSAIADGTLKNVKKVGILIISVPPGDVVLPILKDALTTSGVQTEVVQYDPAQVRDFAPIVAKLKDSGVDMVMGFQTPNDQTLFVQALSGQSWRPQNGFFFTGSPIFLDSFRKDLGKQVAGWVTSSFCASIDSSAFTEQAKKVAADFKAKYGQTMEGSSGCIGATNMALIADAIAAAKSADPEKIAAATRTLSFDNPKASLYPYYMAPGGVKFDANQNNTLIGTPFIQVTADGGFNTVYPKDIATAPLAPYTP